ncbi:MAG: beta-ketoacyl synthase chain length factor [bacterium]
MTSLTKAFDLRLQVLDWNAWAKGRTGKEAWRRWALNPMDRQPDLSAVETAVPSAAAMPPLLRRRAGFSDRLAFDLAYGLVGKETRVPSVFASRHGQIVRSVDLLEKLVEDQPCSPMDFSVSVHNATAGLISIARGDTAQSTSVAAGRESLSSGLLEAQAMVEEGAERVLVVYHDETPPPVLDEAWARESSDWALGLLLGNGKGRTLDMKLEDDPSHQGGDPMPQALALVRLLARGTGEELWRNGRHLWTWGLPA